MEKKSNAGIYITIFILLWIVFPDFCKAETLTLQQTIDEAIKVNINLKSQQEGTQAALARKKVSQTNFLPTFSASYQYTRDHESSLLYGIIQMPQDRYSFVGTITQPLFAGFSIINQYDVAQLGLEMSQLNEQLLRQEVIFAAKQRYFSLLQAQKLLTVSQEAVKQIDAHKTVAQNYYQVGMIPLNDLLKAQLELANTEQNLIIAQNGLEVAQSNLNLILRKDINDPIEIVDMTEYTSFTQDIESCLQMAKQHRLEMKIADLDVNMKEKEVQVAKKDYFPSVSLRASLRQTGTDWDVNGGSIIIDGNSWDVSAVATWNFWEWGRSYQGVKAKRHSLNQSRLKREDIADKIRLEVKQAYLRTIEGEKYILTVEKAIEQAQENFRISEEQYKEQMATSTDVLDAQTLLSGTMSKYYTALYEFKISKASLYKAMGQEILE